MHIRRLTSWHAPVFLVNSRYPLACATPKSSRREDVHHRGSPLCRRHGSNLPSSLTRIRSIASVYSTRPPVSVWGTGGTKPHAEAFLGSRDHRNAPPTGTPITPHPHAPRICLGDGLRAWPRKTTSAAGYPSASLLRSPTCREDPNTPAPHQPEGRRKEGAEVSIPASARSASCRYGNINPFIHSTTPVGLALGPDSPGDDERGPGTLGHPADGIPTRLSLLMSAFSLPQSPRPAHAAASTHAERSPTQQQTLPPRLRWCA